MQPQRVPVQTSACRGGGGQLDVQIDWASPRWACLYCVFLLEDVTLAISAFVQLLFIQDVFESFLKSQLSLQAS